MRYMKICNIAAPPLTVGSESVLVSTKNSIATFIEGDTKGGATRASNVTVVAGKKSPSGSAPVAFCWEFLMKCRQ
jgi:hypothetical protein